MKAVVFYESAENLAEKALLEFVHGDPFVRRGVLRNWTIREWNEALVPDR